MLEKINEKVSATLVYDQKRGAVYPSQLFWQGRTFAITKIGYHHLTREGRNTKHIFSVSNDSLFFKLALDTENLSWTLEEVSDGT